MHQTRLVKAGLILSLFCFDIAHSWCQSGPNEFWQSQSIYQLITDRFFDGDSSNNNSEGNYNPASSRGSKVHGGDFRGIEQKLDYIQALGATAIWLSPIVLNANGEFHGYAARDFYSVAPHWGSLTDLKHLVQAAHARGILVIDDIVCNHGGDLINSTDPGYDRFLEPPAGYHLQYRSSKQFAPPFNTNAENPNLTNLFHNNGRIPDYEKPEHYELGELSGLDDFRTESTYVRSNMVEVFKYWIREVGFDGFRIDTVKHIEMGFWQNWCPQIHEFAASQGKPDFFLFGEVYDHSESKCGSYTGRKSGDRFLMDSVLDYPLYFTLKNVFLGSSGNTKQIEDHYKAIEANYDRAAQMQLVTFLDNHDQPRFMSFTRATRSHLELALVFLYTSRGVPCLYYGTEQGFNGRTDPYDREDMFAGEFEQGPSLGDNFNMTHPLYQWVARLNNFRRLYPALQKGTHINLWSDPTGPGLFAYARRLNNHEVFVVLNTSDKPATLPSRSTISPAGNVLRNLLDTNETVTVTITQEIPKITVPGLSAKIFVAQNEWLPLNPVVVSNEPAHDSKDVFKAARIALHFSHQMDHASVESAFNISPTVKGVFHWSMDGQQLTFQPNESGWPAQSLITVRISDSAKDAISGKPILGGYELRFRTTQ